MSIAFPIAQPTYVDCTWTCWFRVSPRKKLPCQNILGELLLFFSLSLSFFLLFFFFFLPIGCTYYELGNKTETLFTLERSQWKRAGVSLVGRCGTCLNRPSTECLWLDWEVCGLTLPLLRLASQTMDCQTHVNDTPFIGEPHKRTKIALNLGISVCLLLLQLIIN